MPPMLKPRKNRPEPASPNRTYSSVEVSTLASVSLRQLQWWDERKVVSPRHEGHRRVYFPAEVIEITVIAELRRKGFSLQKIRRVLRFLKRKWASAWPTSHKLVPTFTWSPTARLFTSKTGRNASSICLRTPSSPCSWCASA